MKSTFFTLSVFTVWLMMFPSSMYAQTKCYTIITTSGKIFNNSFIVSTTEDSVDIIINEFKTKPFNITLFIDSISSISWTQNIPMMLEIIGAVGGIYFASTIKQDHGKSGGSLLEDIGSSLNYFIHIVGTYSICACAGGLLGYIISYVVVPNNKLEFKSLDHSKRVALIRRCM